jgi:hypothetical protein
MFNFVLEFQDIKKLLAIIYIVTSLVTAGTGWRSS